MKQLRSISYHAVALCLSSLLLSAQDRDLVTLQFLTIPHAQGELHVELLVSEGETIPLKISSTKLSEEVRVPRMASWVFGEADREKNQKPFFNIFGQAEALDAPKQLVLLVRNGANMADGIDVRVVANTIEKVDGGTFYLMNASKMNISGEVGGDLFALKPGAHAIIHPKPDANRARAHARFFFLRDDKARPFFDGQWRVNENARSFLFFYQDTERLRIHSVRHFLKQP